jgi:DNA-binding transcriptional MerR regulator
MDAKVSTPCLTSEAARIVGVNEVTIRKWADNGRLRDVMKTVLGVRVYSRAELERVAAARADKAK